jgi:hypothetical protein
VRTTLSVHGGIHGIDKPNYRVQSATSRYSQTRTIAPPSVWTHTEYSFS